MYYTLSRPTNPAPQFQPWLGFDRAAWEKLMLYVSHCDTEVNGFAYVQQLSPSRFGVLSSDDVFITEQEVEMGAADVTKDTFAQATYVAGRARRTAELRLQWHSHVHGTASFSLTDTGTMDRYASAGMTWFISLVTNKSGQTSARLDVYAPVRLSAAMLVQVGTAPNADMERQVLDDIARLVTVVEPDPNDKLAKLVSFAPRSSGHPATSH